MITFVTFLTLMPLEVRIPPGPMPMTEVSDGMLKRFDSATVPWI